VEPALQPERPGRGAPSSDAPSLGPRHAGTNGAPPDLQDLTSDELRVVASIAALAPALSPSSNARDRMRTRVLAGLAAGAPTVVPGAAPSTGPAATPGSVEQVQVERVEQVQVVELAARRRTGHGARGRFLVAAAAALCLVVALSGISLVLSRDALPGDALYSLKRAGETTRLELTFGDVDRGLRHLDYAARRVDELGALVDRASSSALGTGSGGVVLVAVEQVDPATVGTLLDDVDSQSTAGSGLLTTTGVAGDPTALGSLATWAQGQSARLDALRAQLPSAAQPRLDSSVGVLEQVRGRADALSARLACSPITSGRTDDLGPLPATTACSSAAGTTGTAPTTPVLPPSTATTGAAAPDAQQGGGTGSGPGGSDPGSTGPGSTGPGSTGPGSTAPGSGGQDPGGVAGTVPAAPTQPALPLPLPTGGTSVPPLPLPVPSLLPSTVSVPLPIIPPVTIGPILPGLPPITIGG
jgi:hypothetical protein